MAISHGSIAQSKNCATDEMYRKALQEDPSIQLRRDELERFTQEYVRNQKTARVAQGASRFVIPIVFHIMHDNGIELVTDDQIRDVVRRLNIDYAKLNSDTASVDPRFQSIIGDPKIEFRLAKIDPNGNCTSGINRVFCPFTAAANDNVKTLSAWPHNKYLNIYIVRDILIDLTLPPGSFVAGYAYFPGQANGGFRNEGVVIRSQSMFINVAQNDNGRTLTHEIGHYLNLNHPFVGTVGSDANCNLSDGVDDTPPTKGTFSGCLRTAGQCGTTIPNTENYMDYANCAYMFTQGQVTRMHAALNNSSGSNRANLWSATNRIATGTDDAYVARVCAPNIRMDAMIVGACAGVSYPLTAIVENLDTTANQVTYTWDLPGATVPTLTGRKVYPIYTTAGTYDLKLIATSSGGSDTVFKRNYVTVVPSTVGYRTDTAAESFNSGNNLIDTIARTRTWKTYSTSATTKWQVATAGYFGTKALSIQPFGLTSNGRASVVSPPIDLSLQGTRIINMNLYFRHAAAGNSTQDVNKNSDYLRILVSPDCGANFTEIAYLNRRSSNPNPLYTTTLTANNWRPSNLASSADWSLNTITIPNSVRGRHSRIAFEVYSDNGSIIYVDDFGVGDSRPLSVNDKVEMSSQLAIAPNPATSETQISFELENAATVSIQITDMLGRVVGSEVSPMLDAGLHSILLKDVASNLSKGIYLVSMKAGNKTFAPARVVAE